MLTDTMSPATPRALALTAVVVAGALLAGCPGGDAGGTAEDAAPADERSRALAELEKLGNVEWAARVLAKTPDEDGAALLAGLLDESLAKRDADRRSIIGHLAAWPVGHEVIASALARRIERATWSLEVKDATAFFVDKPERLRARAAALLLNRLVDDDADFGMIMAGGEGLASLALASSVAPILAALPDEPPSRDDQLAELRAKQLLLVLQATAPSSDAVPAIAAYAADPTYREEAAPVLAAIGGSDAARALRRLIDESPRDPRLQAAFDRVGTAASRTGLAEQLGRPIGLETTNDRREAARALAETAGPDDADVLARHLGDEDPDVAAPLLGAIARVLPQGRDALGQAADRALADGRPRTAGAIAAALADAARERAAASALGALRSERLAAPGAEQLLLADRDAIRAAYPDAEMTSKVTVADMGTQVMIERGVAHLAARDGKLLFFGDPCSRIVATPGLAEHLGGLAVGVPGWLAFELHGADEAVRFPTFVHAVRVDGREPFDLEMSLDPDMRIRAITLRPAGEARR